MNFISLGLGRLFCGKVMKTTGHLLSQMSGENLQLKGKTVCRLLRGLESFRA